MIGLAPYSRIERRLSWIGAKGGSTRSRLPRSGRSRSIASPDPSCGSDPRADARARLLDVPADQPAPTLVLPVDQAEELFNADAGPEAARFRGAGGRPGAP